MGVTHLSKLSLTLTERSGAETIATRSARSARAKSFRSVATSQCQITVPNFVPIVPEIVPYRRVSSSYSIVLRRILLRARNLFCANGFAVTMLRGHQARTVVLR